MAIFLDRGNSSFAEYSSCNYVDKTGLIECVNSVLNTSERLVCVTRPRRFGKSVTINMLCAYYDRSCDSKQLFNKFAISRSSSYSKYLNKFPTIQLDVSKLLTKYRRQENLVDLMQRDLIADIESCFPEIIFSPNIDLMDALISIVKSTGQKFIMLIDEWDAIFREEPKNLQLGRVYIDFLRRMFKSDDTSLVFASVYMTGILPIKKYGTQSALNDFREFSMIDPGMFAPYIGFTESEVSCLATNYGMSSDELKSWYDGYKFQYITTGKDEAGNIVRNVENIAVYNPNSVMQACCRGICHNYWSKTESFVSLQQYIDMNLMGVSDKLSKLIQGESIPLNSIRYGDYNINNDDELFTLLTHLGYLNFDFEKSSASIPNHEIRVEFTEALRKSKGHPELSEMIKQSDKLLSATFAKDEKYVAEAIEQLHRKETTPIHYNSEQALRYVVLLAYVSAKEEYISIQEFPSGNGYADIVFIPRKFSDKPVIVIELKWNKTASNAIKHYLECLTSQSANLLLVGISYDSVTKKHACKIETIKHFQQRDRLINISLRGREEGLRPES